ncbi:MAG: hypothetical protein IPL40_06990 [Proteobacteria bacterium]|nr:hypothetical protein [Pseudomonadota bacterium]
MAERQHDSLVTSLASLKQMEQERVAAEQAAARALALAEQEARANERRLALEAEAARQRAEAERARLAEERRATEEREQRQAAEAARRRSAIEGEERLRRVTVAGEAVAAARVKAARLRWGVALSIVIALGVLGGIGYQVRQLYRMKQSATQAVAQNARRTHELRAQIAELRREQREDVRRNSALINAFKRQLESAPLQAREELSKALQQAEAREALLKAQQERTRRRLDRAAQGETLGERL